VRVRVPILHGCHDSRTELVRVRVSVRARMHLSIWMCVRMWVGKCRRGLVELVRLGVEFRPVTCRVVVFCAVLVVRYCD
jgi:hypothetical protein